MDNKTLMDDLITEDEAAELLKIGINAFRNMIYSKKIPADYYTKAITGKRFFFKSKLLGLHNQKTKSK
jgi:hypothetical protein